MGYFQSWWMESHQGCGDFQVLLHCHVPGLNFVRAQGLNQTPIPRKYPPFRYLSSPFKKIFSQGAQQTSHHTWLLNKAVGRWEVEELGPTPHAQHSQESQSSLKALATPKLKLSVIRKCCPCWTLVANSSRYAKIYPPPMIYDLTSLSLNYSSLPSTSELEWHDHVYLVEFPGISSWGENWYNLL